MANSQPHNYEFLTLCSTRFDITIQSSTTQPNLIPRVSLLLGEGLEIKLVFVWGSEKCQQTCNFHPFNKSQTLKLKNMDKFFKEISLRFRQLFCYNIMFIDDCPQKCMGNVLFMGSLWPWLVGLFEPFNTPQAMLDRVSKHGSHHHRKPLRIYAWSPIAQVIST